MSDQVVTVTVKGVGDFSDVVNNVGSVQKALTKLKLPDKLGDNLNKNITAFYKEYEKYQQKIAGGLKTQGDYNQVEKSLNTMRSLYQAIGADAQKLLKLDMKDLLNLDTGEFKKISNDITNIMKQIGNIKIDTTPFTKAINDIRGVTKNSKISGEDGLLNKILGNINSGQIVEAKKALQELKNYADKVAPRETASGGRMPGTLSPDKYNQLTSAINVMNGAVAQAEATMDPLIKKQNDLQRELEETKQKAASGIEKEFKGYNEASNDVERVTDSLKKMHQEEFSFNHEVQNIDRQIQSYFGLSQMIRKVGDIARDAFATVKELDKAMTETAVVTNFSVGDMWDMLPTYTAQANQLGSTIKDVYEAATLYYQQGLNTNQAMGLANETLKMARIAGLGAAEATDMMTAALRGFNMEINQQSAQKINDIYSELAAITASDTAEIGSAMERTASIANSANMEFATTSAFLAQMIETTREAPENLGTAMKTIVARFQEMKQDPTKLIDSEGVAMDANKVDKALKTIGVNLMNTKGEFRDLDDVFLDISQRWDSLTQGQQRYIATIAAGSRQQSRFIAMMSNYERTMELVDAANNSAGASQRQFEKTLDSMEAKLNKLKNAWDQFTMGLMNNQILKFGVDALTEGFTIINKFIDILGKIPPKPFEGVTKSALTLATTLGMLQLGKKLSRGLITGGISWWENGKLDKETGQKIDTGGFKKGFASGWGIKPEQQGLKDGQAYAKGFELGQKSIQKGINFSNSLKDIFSLKQFKANQHQLSNDSIIKALLPESSLEEAARADAQKYIESLKQDLRAGKISKEDLPTMLESGLGVYKDLDTKAINPSLINAFDNDKIVKLESTFNGLAGSIGNAGNSLTNFGALLQGTPLAPFGSLLMTVGTSLTALSGILTGMKASLLSTIASQIGLNTELEITSFSALKAAAAEAGLTVTTGTLAGAVWSLMWPLLAVAAVIGTIYGAYKLLDAAIETNKEKLESASDAAAAASEAYDSAKQETSELSDAIEQVKTNEDAFDGLVVGTAAFNEQLVTANDQIMELIKKYPMLNDYLTTDKNGLMHISDEGLDAVKDYQKQLQANASALNLIQTADLNSVEAQQKAKQMRKTKGTDTLESLAQRKQEADLIEQQAEAQQQMAKLNAVNTALVDKEIGNREKVSAILADQYDSRREAISLEGESIHDLKQEYADFYGYKYDKSTKKITDIEGNEIDVDKATVKDAVKDIRILTDIEVDGKSLDNMINHINSTFSQALGSGFEESGSLFSDILSDNIDIEDDLLQNLLTNPDKLQSAVDSLSEKEIAAVLGVSADAVEQAPDKYKDELTNKLTEKATNIAETQAQSYADLAAMLAQTTSADVSQLIDASGQATTNAQKANQQAIKEQLEKLTSEQKNTLSSIGNILNENAGAETMRTFIRQAADIYTKGTKESITTLDTIIKDVNWSSPTARLKAYNDMINSTDKDVQNLGNSLRKSSESSNLLGEAFEEFYDSSDFQEMAENMDKFADSSGKLNASSIQEMAKECNSLNNLLDTGAISAGGVAAALNAMGRDGNITILDLNENLLKFLSTANQLDDVLSEAHSLIENFDWGVDAGESEDFAKDSSKKWKELYDNGEFGNQQLENYAKFVLGQERWNKELEASGGNIETALNNMSKDILKYSDGFDQAWEDMASSSSDKFKDFHYSEDEEDIIWETNGRTTQQLVEDLAEARGITQEWAKLMVEDFANYSYDFKTELASNDFAAALKNGDYITNRTGKNGEVNMTQNELATLAAAQNKTEEEILSDIQKYGKVSEDQLNVIKTMDEKGNLLMGSGDIASLNTQYSQAELGKNTDKSWISQYTAKTRQGQPIEGSTDLKTAISGAIADGFQAEQATEMARAEAYQAFKDGAQVFYDGVALNEEDLADSQAFADKIAEITENSRWNAVGEAIAQGYISYIKGGNTDNPNNSNNSGNQGSNWGSAKDDAPKSSFKRSNVDWDSANAEHEAAQAAAREKSKQAWSNLWNKVKEAFTGSNEADLAAAQAQKSGITGTEKVTEGLSLGIKEGFDASTVDPKTQAKEKAQKDWKEYWAGVNEGANTAQPQQGSNNNGSSNAGASEVPKESQQNLSLTYTATITNSGEMLASVNQQIDQILQSAASKTRTVNATGSIKVNYAKGEQAKASNQNAKVNYLKGTQAKPEAMNAKVNYTKGTQVSPVDKTAKVDYKRGTQEDPKDKTAYVTYKKKGSGGDPPSTGGFITNTGVLYRAKGGSIYYPKKGTDRIPAYLTAGEYVQNRDAVNYFGIDFMRKINHKDLMGALQSFGSAAKGKYGRLGPNGKGGLTLTGEEGFEIAWLPSESRSMILGLNGPQMISLPSDAVVYTHEESEEILKEQEIIDAGSHAGKHRKKKKAKKGKGNGKGKSKGKGKGKKNKKKKSNKKTTPTINNFSMEEVKRFNVDKAIDDLNTKITQTERAIEQGLSQVGVTYDAIKGSVDAQTQALNGIKSKNQDLLNSYQRQLNEYLTKQAYVSWTDSKGNSKRTKINISDYLNADGTANEAAIKNAGGPALQEAIYKEISQAKTWTDGIKNAQNAIDDANKKIDELNKKVADTFYNWENQLTWIYDLTQRLNNIQSLRDRFSEQITLELDKVATGFQDTATAISNVRKATERDNKALLQSIATQREMVAARKDALTEAYSWEDEQTELTYQTKQNKNPAVIEAAQKELQLAQLMRKYITNYGERDDGSIYYEIDWALLKQDKQNLNIGKDDYDKIYQRIENLNSEATEYNNSIKDLTSAVDQIYQNIAEYQQLQIDLEGDLLEQVEEQTEENIDQLKDLSSSISDALKDLLDDVKRKLDERRQQEDNRKTEQSISQKQQRLAALQADTSGGHQVEIAQLQKEIAEEQQSYQQTLEDQLLDKLQQQSDLAAEQRERQISLMEQQNEIGIDNRELVRKWVENPELYQNEIKETLKEKEGYDKAGFLAQEGILRDIDKRIVEAQHASEQLETAQTTEDSSKSSEKSKIQSRLNTAQKELETASQNTKESLEKYHKARQDGASSPEIQQLYKEYAHAKAYEASLRINVETLLAKLKELGIDSLIDVAKETEVNKADKQATTLNTSQGFKTGTDTTANEARAKEDYEKEARAKTEQAKIAEQAKQQAATKAAAEAAAKKKAEEQKAAAAKAAQDKQNKENAYIKYLKSVKALKSDKVKASHVNELFRLGSPTGRSKATVLLDLVGKTGGADPFSWKNIFKAIIDAKGIDRYNLVKTWPNGDGTLFEAIKGLGNPDTPNEIKKKSQYKNAKSLYSVYATGGLANYTGPAWLDGTPSKPELVLNSTDTKNFIALKDVLSKAMGSTNAIENSYGGDTTFEININVDHLNNDYDVDKVAERVKKIIVKDSSYRNVTQVRNFR